MKTIKEGASSAATATNTFYKENIKGSLNEIRHGVKDTVKVLKNLQVIVIERLICITNHLVIIVRSSFNIELFFSICPMDIVDI